MIIKEKKYDHHLTDKLNQLRIDYAAAVDLARATQDPAQQRECLSMAATLQQQIQLEALRVYEPHRLPEIEALAATMTATAVAA